MYRTYRDPHLMEAKLEEAEAALEKAKATCDPDNDFDLDRLIDLQNDVEYWREQVNFAWQDNEAEVEGYE